MCQYPLFFQLIEQTCKPSSVLDDHLSRRIVANALMRPYLKRTGQVHLLLFGLAPGGVYRAFSVAGKAVSFYLAFPPLPAKQAVYFCCTFLGVASTGGYPAPCPMELGLSSWQNHAVIQLTQLFYELL